MSVLFRSKLGDEIPGCTAEEWSVQFSKLTEDGFSPLDPIIGASYSFAMVIRYALGLSSNEGQVAGFVADSPFGWTVLSTLIHIVDGGGLCTAFICPSQTPYSNELTKLMLILKNRGAELVMIESTADRSWLERMGYFHNILAGMGGADKSLDPFLKLWAEEINEHPIPVHSVGSPVGLNQDTGVAEPYVLFSSSTLSLGIPFSGLNQGADYVGRHYLCDMSFAKTTYRDLGYSGESIFREQPVVQIFT